MKKEPFPTPRPQAKELSQRPQFLGGRPSQDRFAHQGPEGWPPGPWLGPGPQWWIEDEE